VGVPDGHPRSTALNAPLRLDAPAKLNLSLRVVGRRDDGFHLLESRMVLLELADRLLLLPGSSGLRLDGDAAGLPVGDENLAWRGLLAGMDGTPDVACLALEKRIPLASGLGGGSSDAAAAWRLGRAWRGVSEDATAMDLDRLGRIGADVPFFAARLAAARVGGIGERIEPTAASESHVILVHPGFGLSTAAVFAELTADDWGSSENDLLAPALRLRPELDDLLALVGRTGVTPRMTGSGPTIFALTDDPLHAASVVERLIEAGLHATITRTRTSATSIEAIEEEPE
jgi:4-diphosphocytidyl-2-C-methyl-D-erythritol kinase